MRIHRLVLAILVDPGQVLAGDRTIVLASAETVRSFALGIANAGGKLSIVTASGNGGSPVGESRQPSRATTFTAHTNFLASLRH
ncbi:MAG: hypothetical protein L0Y60_13015 [Beijerinckiaceae bacterium]|nr:hypothetical protein [Beijerinckiaceae bacterium]